MINLIPKNKFFNATDLIELLISKGKKVSKFTHYGYWRDIGSHSDYKRTIEEYEIKK